MCGQLEKKLQRNIDLKIINEQPTSFWFGSGRKTMKNVDKKVRRLLQRANPIAVLVYIRYHLGILDNIQKVVNEHLKNTESS